MARTQELERQIHRTLAKRRIIEVRLQRRPDGDGLFIALDDGTVVALWMGAGAATHLPVYKTHDDLDQIRKRSDGEWRKFFARALNRLRSWETGWNMPRNRRVNVRDRRKKVRHPQSRTSPAPLRPRNITAFHNYTTYCGGEH